MTKILAFEGSGVCISHLSQIVVVSSLEILVVGGGPGSLSVKIGIAKDKKAFLYYSIGALINTLHNSIVYSPAIHEVVVAKAGIILPAFNLTLIQSIYSSLYVFALKLAIEYI